MHLCLINITRERRGEPRHLPRRPAPGAAAELRGIYFMIIISIAIAGKGARRTRSDPAT